MSHTGTRKKSSAQLEREIEKSLADRYPHVFGKAGLWRHRAKETRAQITAERTATLPPKRARATVKHAEAEDLDRRIAPTLGKSRAQVVRAINAITRAADGRNVYLLRERLGESQVRRITRARTKGRGMEVHLLDSGNWIGVLPELGDRIDVR